MAALSAAVQALLLLQSSCSKPLTSLEGVQELTALLESMDRFV